MVQVVTDANFEVETQEGVVLVDFWAPWCGPCRMQAPILEQLDGEVDEDELRIYKMNVDENPNTARQFGIMSIPTLLFKKDGKVVNLPKTWEELVDLLSFIIEKIDDKTTNNQDRNRYLH